MGTLGLKARGFVERNSWDNIADEFERVLEETVEEKKRKVFNSKPDRG